MQCGGCNRELQPGDLYIEDTSSGFVGAEPNETVDELVSWILGGPEGKVVFCEACTVPDPNSRYHFLVVEE